MNHGIWKGLIDIATHGSCGAMSPMSHVDYFSLRVVFGTCVLLIVLFVLLYGCGWDCKVHNGCGW